MMDSLHTEDPNVHICGGFRVRKFTKEKIGAVFFSEGNTDQRRGHFNLP